MGVWEEARGTSYLAPLEKLEVVTSVRLREKS